MTGIESAVGGGRTSFVTSEHENTPSSGVFCVRNFAATRAHVEHDSRNHAPMGVFSNSLPFDGANNKGGVTSALLLPLPIQLPPSTEHEQQPISYHDITE